MEGAALLLERFCGRPFNYDRLSEFLATLKEAGRLRSRCWDLATNVPAPCTFMDLIAGHGPVLYAIGPQTVDYFQKLKEELEQRVAQKIAAIPGEKYRLFWDNMAPWHSMGLLAKKMASLKANFIVGRYVNEMWPCPEALDPEHPLETLAEQFVRYWTQILSQSSLTPFSGESFIANAIQKYHLDGVVMHHIITCRVYSMGQHDIIAEMEKRFGIPGIIIEGDQTDAYFFSEAQFDLRLRALLEMIDSRRK